MKVDILLATYNSEPYISELLDSILHQTYSDWNLLVRDDKSEDSTVDTIKKYAKKDSRIKLLEDDLGKLGASGNFARLLTLSSGDLVMFADHDDVWFCDKIKTLVDKYIQVNENGPVLIHCDALITNKNLEKTGGTFLNGRARNRGLHSMIFTGFVQGASMMINRKLVSMVMPFPPNVYYDYFIALVSETFGKRFVVDAPYMYYRLHERNAIGKQEASLGKMFRKLLCLDFKIFGDGERESIVTFLERFKDKIAPCDKKMLEKCLSIGDGRESKLSHLYYVLRYGFNSDGSVLKLFTKVVFRKK